jgi:DNA-binding MurR/RpiR family transcriptional regulator
VFIYNGIDIIEWLHNITEKDVVISISLPRYLKHVVRFSELAHKRGAFVIALSDGYTSPFIAIADIVFFVDGKSRDFHNAMTSSMFIADILIGVLASQNSKKAKTNLKDTENILSLFDQTVY